MFDDKYPIMPPNAKTINLLYGIFCVVESEIPKMLIAENAVTHPIIIPGTVLMNIILMNFTFK